METTAMDVRGLLAEHSNTINVEAYRALAMFRGNNAVGVDDLVSIAQYAAINALANHNPALGSVRSYLKVAIRRRLVDEARSNSLYSRNEVQQHKAEEWKNATRYAVSLDAPVGGDVELSLHDFLGTEGGFRSTEDAMLMSKIDKMLDLLPPRQASAMRLCISGHTLKQIGTQLGISESRVCQLQHRAVQNLIAIRDTGAPLQSTPPSKKSQIAANPVCRPPTRIHTPRVKTPKEPKITQKRVVYHPKLTKINVLPRQEPKKKQRGVLTRRVYDILRAHGECAKTLLGPMVYADYKHTNKEQIRLGVLLNNMKRRGFATNIRPGVWIPLKSPGA